MAHSPGRAAGGGSHLAPPSHRPSQSADGFYIADLRHTVRHRDQVTTPAIAAYALLTHPPSPEGYGYCELFQGVREKVPVERIGQDVEINAAMIAFPLGESSEPPTHIGGFSADGELVAYGPLRRLSSDHAFNGVVCFGPGNLRVKRH